MRVALKRKIYRLFGFPIIKAVSLYRKESPAFPSKILGDHAGNITLTIWDPRSKSDVGHHFNTRYVRQLNSVVLEPSQALIYTQGGQIINESTCWPIANVFISYPWLPRQTRRKDIDAGIPLSSASFYHWLIEDLPGTISAMKSSSNIPLLFSSNAPRYVHDFLRISKHPHLELTNPVNVGTLVITEKQTDTGWPHPRDIAVLEEFKLRNFHSKNNSKEKIYVSRRFSKRSPGNENEIERLFTEFGFKIIYSEKLDLSAQIEIFESASHVAGIHGAGLSNIVWTKQGTKILEIANTQLWNECFHRLASVKKLAYEYFIYEGALDEKIDLARLKAKLVELNYDK